MSALPRVDKRPRIDDTSPLASIERRVARFNAMVDQQNPFTYTMAQWDNDQRQFFNESIFPILDKCWRFALNKQVQHVVEFQSLLTSQRYDPPNVHTLASFMKTHKDKKAVLSLKIYKKVAKEVYLLKIWFENPQRSEVKIGYQPSMDMMALHKQVDILGPDAARGVAAVNRFSENKLAIPPAAAKAGPTFDPLTNIVYNHIKQVICGGNQAYTNFFCSWLAFIMQERRKTGVAIVLTGEHGCGKTILFDYICEKIIGKTYAYPLDNISMINSSGDSLNEAILVVSNELQSISKNLYQRMKTYITSERQQTKGPHEVAQVHHDFSNLVIAANGRLDYGEVIPMESTERRFVFFEVSSRLLKESAETQKKYFTELWRSDPRPFARYLYELKHDYHPGKSIKTDAFFHAKRGAFDPLTKWWYSCLQVGAIVNKKDNIVFSWLMAGNVRSMRAVKQEVYQAFLDSGAGKVALNIFWPKLLDMKAGTTSRINAHDKARIITFNSLADCRAAFAALNDVSLPWFQSPEEQQVLADALVAKTEAEKDPAPEGNNSVIGYLHNSDDDEDDEADEANEDEERKHDTDEPRAKRSRSTSPASQIEEYHSASEDEHMDSDESEVDIFTYASLNIMIMDEPKNLPPFDITQGTKFGMLAFTTDNMKLCTWATPYISKYIMDNGCPINRANRITQYIIKDAQSKGDIRENLLKILSSNYDFWSAVLHTQERVRQQEEEMKIDPVLE